jgi:hypothetical protein
MVTKIIIKICPFHPHPVQGKNLFSNMLLLVFNCDPTLPHVGAKNWATFEYCDFSLATFEYCDFSFLPR